MKKSVIINTLLTLLLVIPGIIFATTTSSTARGLNIDGNVSDQDDASAGTNGTSWETNEDLSGNSAT